jgi:hypothetical protein
MAFATEEKDLASVSNSATFDDKTAVKVHDEETSVGSMETIDIDPKRLAAAFRKFDLFVLPVSVIFLVLSSLDRNNVCQNTQSNNNPANEAIARKCSCFRL